MTETVLIDIDPLLLERIRRVSAAQDWGLQQALVHLLEHGLFACEAELKARFDDSDAQALQEAIAALEQIQDDPGFALIGRVEAGEAEPSPQRSADPLAG
jgi:hypothetical protein